MMYRTVSQGKALNLYSKCIVKLLQYFKQCSDVVRFIFSKGCYLQKARTFEQKD